MAKPKGGKPPLTNCTPDDVSRALKKIGGFIEKGGSKHDKFEHTATGHCSEIPRHTRVKMGIMNSFIKSFLIGKCGLTEAQIYEYLWC